MSDTIDYGNLMHRAMRTLIKEVLNDVAENGLPGQHHFFITFDTMHPDVEIADWLSDRYPGEMTVVLQYGFENLEVGDSGFSVALKFGDNPEALFIPYDAIVTFVDPSVEFGLRFDSHDDEPDVGIAAVDSASDDEIPEAPMTEADPAEETPKDAEVVSLDSFRKT